MTDVKSIFSDPSEHEIAQLQSGTIAPAGSLTSHYCVLTEKRLYHRGISFTSGSGNALAENENIIQLKDISSTGFTSQKKLSYLFFAILFLLITAGLAIFYGTGQEELKDILIPCIMVAGIMTLLMFVLYFVIRRKVFSIYFAGGELSFLANGCRIKTLREFSRAIHIANDKINDPNKAEIAVEEEPSTAPEAPAE